MTAPAKITLLDQINELRAVVEHRAAFCRGHVARGQMTEAEAETHLIRIATAVETLEWLHRNEKKVREAVS